MHFRQRMPLLDTQAGHGVFGSFQYNTIAAAINVIGVSSIDPSGRRRKVPYFI